MSWHRKLAVLPTAGRYSQTKFLAWQWQTSTHVASGVRHPRMVESGPAAGVLMSALVGKEAGEPHVVTCDMGGTPAKLGAVDAGEPAVTSTFEINPIR